MKLTIVLTLFCLFQLQANVLTYSQSTRLSIKMEGVTLKQVFNEIEKKSEFIFVYYDDIVALDKKVNINVTNGSIDKILDKLFESTENTFEIFDRQVVVKQKQVVNYEIEVNPIAVEEEVLQQKVSGTVVDGVSSEPLIGVNVVVEGTTIGVVTDINGAYSLQIPKGEAVIIFSYIGYNSEKVKYSGQSVLDIKLIPEITKLGEVVVVGYGTQKRATVTGAISSIETKQLLQSPQANLSNALVGRMSGLLAVQRSGEPGADQSTLRIRGVGTFTGDSDPLVMVDGIESGNYNNIDPNEIESITILKDASATAVYGVRGANGVLLITTKRGKVGKPQFSLTTSYANSRFTDLRQSLGSYDFARLFNEARKYDSYITGTYTERFKPEDIEKYRTGSDPVFYPNSNWQDLLLKKSSGQYQTNLNISGGTERVKYFVSAGILSQDGLFKTDEISSDYDPQIKYKRYNFRSNLDFEVTKKLSVSLNVSSEIEDKNGPNTDSRTILDFIMRDNPISSPGLYNGKLVNVEGLTKQNPFETLLQNGVKRTYKNYLKGAATIKYNLDAVLSGLSAQGTLSYQNYMDQNTRYYKNILSYLAVKTTDGKAIFVPQGEDGPFGFEETSGKNRTTYAELKLDYKKSFGVHNVSGMVLYKQSKYFANDLAYLVPNGHQGLSGRVTYDFANRYLGEFSLGYEGTENFAPGKRFGFFPAASLGWVISEEPFFPKNNIVSFLKLRATSGMVGNDKVGKLTDVNNRFLFRESAYLYGGGYRWGEVGSTANYYSGANEGKLGYPGLIWEEAKKQNIGFDLSLFDNKISITGDWFDEKRSNILASQQTLPSYVGASLPSLNLGKMRNHGFEGDISYKGKVADFNYWVKFNMTFARNEIEFQDEVQKTFSYQNRTGQRYGQFFGFIAEGLFNSWEEVNDPNRPIYYQQNNRVQPGDIKYKDVNGDGYINVDDEVPIGYSNFPEKVYGLSLGGNFKGFDFSMLMQGATNVSMNCSRRTNRGFFDQESGAPELLLYSWSQERYDNGEKILLPHLSIGFDNQKMNYVNSSFWIRDAKYLRIKNVEVGYTFMGSLLTKIGLGSARIYVNGSNLYTWDNLFPGEDPELGDPETNYEPYPVTSTINVGLNVKF